MKLKKILTIFIFSILAFTGVFFGCKDKYENFSIKINGENEIKLRAGNSATDDIPNSMEVEVLLKNAPDDNCRVISYSASPTNIVKIDELTSSSKDIKKYKITALENITAFDPSTVITFSSVAGKQCELKVNVEIPIAGISRNLDYTPFVVSDGKPYYINITKAIKFTPENTTQRDVEFSLEKDIVGVSLTKFGEIRVSEDYFKNENVSSQIKVKATSTHNSGYSVDLYISVLRDIRYEDLTISYLQNGNELSFSCEKVSGEENYETSINYLMQNGIILASNGTDELRNTNLSFEIKPEFGLNFDEIDLSFENMVISNVLLEKNSNEDTTNKKNFVIYSTNPGVDTLVAKIKYKNVENYSKTIQIPIKVLEYPISLVVNNSASTTYNIFDFYKDNPKGQEFSVVVSQTGAYDKSFKVKISEDDFSFVEIRYQDELLGYEELSQRTFENNSSLFIKAKDAINENKEISIYFYSNILEENEIENDANKNLSKKINLNLVPGLRSLNFEANFDAKEMFYLEKTNCELTVPFVINNTQIQSLNQYVSLEIVKGSDLVDIERNSDGYFVLKSKGKIGNVEFYLKSDSGIETAHKKVFVYAGFDENSDKFEIDLSGSNIKKIKEIKDDKETTKNFIGTTYGKNSANFRVLNPQNASIYNATITSDNNAIVATLLDKDELSFNLYATQNVTDAITITVSIWVYNNNNDVNSEISKKLEDLTFEIFTYEPLSGVTFNDGSVSSEIELIDGEGLDQDSLTNKLNMLDLNKIVSLKGLTEGNKSNIGVKLVYPSELKEASYGEDGEIVKENDFHEELKSNNEIFNKIYFHVYKNHQNKFVNGRYVFGLTIQVSDLTGDDEPYLLTLKVVLKQQTSPEKVVINNEMGFVYLSNMSSNIAKIDAEVVGKNGQNATNKNLYFELVEGTNITLDENTGIVNFVSAGIAKVRVYAKGSKYSKNSTYSIYKDVYVVTVDGSLSYPYILENENNVLANKYYTLNKNIEISASITSSIAGIDGKFKFAKYSDGNFNENSVYNLIFNGTGSVFASNDFKFKTKLENLNIVYNKNKIEIDSDFGLLATENAGEIKNVNLVLNSLDITNSSDALNNVGLFFSKNSGKIENCTITSFGANAVTVILNNNPINFGGFVGVNASDGKILSDYNFLKNSNNYYANLKIIDLTTSGENCVAGVVAQNVGLLGGIKIEADITSNAKFVGGIAGKIESEKIEYKNLYFSGKINAKNENSVVGGIAGKVQSSMDDASKIDFSLIFAEFTGEVSENNSNLSGHTVGGLFGSVDFKGNNRTNVKYAYAQSFCELENSASDLYGLVVGGLVGTNASIMNLKVVFSDVKISSQNAGAFVGDMKANVSIDSAYTYSKGAENLIGTKTGNLKLNIVYATASTQTENAGESFAYFYDKNNYVNTISNENFKTGNFAYFSLKNGGLPYLVYNETDGYKNLMTTVATSLNAKFVVKEDVENSRGQYVYGLNQNIVVVKDNELNKAVIYFKNNLQFNVNDILNITLTPSDADADFVFKSLNPDVISITNGKINIIKTGNAIIEIYAKKNLSVKTFIYISVVEKVDEFVLDDNSITISRGQTKEFKTTSDSQNGLYFDLKSQDVSENILINNKQATDNIIFTTEARLMITGLDTFSEQTINIAPFYQVKFGETSYNFIDFDFITDVQIKVVNFASVITTSVNYFAIPENEKVTFEVYVDSDAYNQQLVFENFESYLYQYFEIDATNKETIGNLTKFVVYVAAKDVSLDDDRNFELVIRHSIDGEINNNIFAKVNILLKSSKLQSVELNHYSSTVTYYDEYNYIINKETIPSFEITKGNLGVLSINLYPSFANITDIDITSSIQNGNRISFSQLKFNENGELVVTSHKDSLPTGIKLNINKNELIESGGNIYVSTLLSTNILDDTIFTITVTCYYGLGHRYEPVTINLKAKALTTIMLSNPDGTNNFYVPKGASLALDINAINMEEDFTPQADNFEFSVNGRELFALKNKGSDFTDNDGFNYLIDTETKSIFGYKIEGGQGGQKSQLVIKSDIMNARDTKLTIKPVFTKVVNGKEVNSEGSPISVCVVDYVVKNVSVYGSVDGILTNYLGNSSLLKAKLDVNACTDFYYYDASGKVVEKLYYGENNQDDDDKHKIQFNSNQRELEYSNLMLKIKTLTEQVSKSNYAWNIITQNSSGNTIYNNIKENVTYSNFVVTMNSDGYYVITGKNVSENRMMLKVNIKYDKGLVSLDRSSDNEFTNEFVLDVKTQSSIDHPTPISTVEEFLGMSDDGNYILLNDITLPADFGGIDAKILSFDGNNKIINIQGFNVSSTSQTSLGLFNEIKDQNTIIKNVIVNILPTLFYAGNDYMYGLNINSQNLQSLNFGVICGTNNGVITNCHVYNNNYKLINNKNAYKNIDIFVNTQEENEVNVGGLVGVNNGYITYSSVGNKNSSNMFTIHAKAKIGGLVGNNTKKIASSYVVNTTIYNNSKSKLTAGFVAENEQDAYVTSSYVQGYSENPSKIASLIQIVEGGIFANSYVGGFVTVNAGFVKDCYSNIAITTNKRSSGFVYDNTNGNVETCLSASSATKDTQSFRYFTGNDEENLTLNNNGIKYCYYLHENINGGEGEFDEPANGIESFDDASYFEGFISDTSSSSVWSFGNGLMPRLVDADQDIVCERQLSGESQISDQTEEYDYIYINNNIGSINNPIVVSTTEQFFDAFTNENYLYSYYYNGKINKTKINYNHIVVVKDLDLSKIIDKNNNEINSTTEVQKLQDIIFAGSLNVNNMLLENITITARNDKVKYSSFGLFKQIGVESTYDNYGNIKNNNLDEDNCTVIKNANFEIDGISATITKTVGTLSGEIINTKLYNINVYSNNGVVVTGNNIVGGVAGRISGNSFVKGVSSNLSVKATYDNKSANYEYSFANTKRIYKNAYDIIQEENNEIVNIVGGVFGVVDIYKTTISSFVENAGTNSYFVNANITRENDMSFDNAQIQFVKVSGDIQVVGDIVGGLFGYVLEGSKIYDAKFVLNESNTQNLIANYAVGGVCGINKGLISYATVETELSRQRIIDKTSQDGYKTSYLFSNSSNKAIFVGGLVGILENGTLNYSYNKANIIATNSRYVGSSVGAFVDARIEYVYAVSYLEAQQEINQNGLVTRQKGYAGFIGTVVSFNNQSAINHVVSLIRNSETPSTFGLAGIIGYNQVAGIKNVVAEMNSSRFAASNGYVISDGVTSSYTYQQYVEQDSGTFVNYNTSDCFVRTLNLDTFYRLTYNKKGAVRNVSSEKDLRNLAPNGKYVLENDIYLTSPWDPIGVFKGEFYSAERKNQQNGQSKYYVIYNLTINADSKNVSQNVGFFASTKNAKISNITFVVGSNYVDPGKGLLPTETNANWGNGTNRGIIVSNNDVEEDYSLGVLSAIDNGSTITNVTIEFDAQSSNGSDNLLTTNLNYVGGLIGRATNTTVKGDGDSNGATIKNLSLKRDQVKGFDAYVGGLVGKTSGGSYKNISFEGTNAIYNLQGQENSQSFIGGVFGYADSVILENLNVLEGENSLKINHNADGIAKSGEKGSTIFAGAVGGYIKGKTINKVVLNNTLVDVSNNYQNMQNLYVGGLVGYHNAGEISNVKIAQTCNIIAKDNAESTKSNINAVGGICGYSQKGRLDSVITSGNVSFEAISSSGLTNIGGVVGRNGINRTASGEQLVGSTLSNIINKGVITVKDKTKSTCCVGGLVGYNYKAGFNNTWFVGTIKNYCELTNIGGLVGNNISDNDNLTNSYFVEDVSLTPSRKKEFGTAIKYSDFVDDKKISNNDENGVLTNIKQLLKTLNTNILDDVSKFVDEDINVISGETISFKEGSVYNPIKITEEWTVNAETKSLQSQDGKLQLEDGKYYLLVNDITTSETISEIKGFIVGNEHKITVSKTFATTINQNAVLSVIIFALSSSNISTFNGNEFVNDVQTIVANTNNGAIFNTIVVGNMFVDDKNVAPVVLQNSGIINVVTSKAHIVVKSLNNDVYASGFVVLNTGAIYNSISTGNIEFVENGGNYYIATKYSGGRIYGFSQTNNDTMINCVSGVTLPIMDVVKDKINNSFGTQAQTSKFSNCFVDISANGNYKDGGIPTGVSFANFETIFNTNDPQKLATIKDNNNNLSNLWSTNDASILFGYAYPSISAHEDFGKDVLNTTETKDGKTTYLVNNLSSYNFVINSLNNNKEKIENSEEFKIKEINIKQIASFVGSIQKQNSNGNIEEVLTQKPIELEKSLNYNGNNFVIHNLILSSNLSDDNTESVTGLFWSNNDINITISNLALTNSNFKVITAIKKLNVSGNDNPIAINNIYAGSFVAKSNGAISISGCYIDGIISDYYIDSENKIANGSTKFELSNAGDLYVGGFVGYNQTAKSEDKEAVNVSNCVSKLNITLNYLQANISFEDSKVARKGYKAVVGGIAGSVISGTISNNYNFGDVVCSSAVTLKMGGIVGNIAGGSLTKNAMFGTVSYKGAYLSYYADSTNRSKLNYNINAVAGEIETGVSIEESGVKNAYNSMLSLTKDANITDETKLTDLFNKINTLTTTDFNNPFTFGEQTLIFAKPNIVTVDDDDVESDSYTFANDTIYIINTTKDFKILTENNKSLTNTKILFANNHTTTISENIFDKLTNCTISNLTIKAETELKTPALAKEIDNTKLYNIKVEDVYINRTDFSTQKSADYTYYTGGGVVDIAKSSILAKVTINKGRVSATYSTGDQLYFGGIVGYAESTLLSECENSATITGMFSSGSINYTAGILGYSKGGYLFKCTNNGLVYAKNTTSNKMNIRTSGIVNATGSADVVSFCQNEQNIKSVNGSSDLSTENLASGISDAATVLFSISKGNAVAISGSKNSQNVIANGVGGGNVFFSYHMGAVMSTSLIYTITNENAYYCYSLGSGYTTASQGNDLPPVAKNRTYCYNADDILSPIAIQGNNGTNQYWFNKLATAAGADFSIYNIDSSDITKKQPIITLLEGENGFTLTPIEGKYQISSAFELWWWSYYGNKTINVELLDDVDMTGYGYLAPLEFTGTFNGKYHTISSLVFSKGNANNSWGFVGTNKGTIQNINFENPTIKITKETEIGENNFVSIVAGQNYGTIENIIVGQVGETNSFINIDYSTDDMKRTNTCFYIGVIAGKNNEDSIISNCNVINLSTAAIKSNINVSDTTGAVFSFDARNIFVHAGGIVGENIGSIGSCSYVSAISAKLRNVHVYGASTGDEIVDLFAYPFYSHAKQFVGLIVGKGTANVPGCVAPNDKNFYRVTTTNAYKSEYQGKYSDDNDFYKNGVGREIGSIFAKTGAVVGTKLAVNVMKKLKNTKFSKVAANLVKIATKGGKTAAKTGSKLIPIIGWAYVIIDASLAIAQEANNLKSFANDFNTMGLVNVDNMTGLELTSPYISPYVEGNTSTQIYGTIKTSKIPYNKNFINLSQTKVKPKQEDEKYYVYNVNELAYALTQNSVTNIVLMNNIDMTRKVWDLGLKAGLTITTNGFKIVYGTNTTFKDSIITSYPDLYKTTTNDKGESIIDINNSCLVEQTDNANEFGVFEKVTRNMTQAAYDNFETYFTEQGGKILNKGVYQITSAKQIEVIADAMTNYTVDGVTHKAIDFSGKKFVLDDDIVLSDKVYSIDFYNYQITNNNSDIYLWVEVDGKEQLMTKSMYNEKFKNYTDDKLPDFDFAYLLPDFYKDGNKYIKLSSGNSLKFNGEFDGKGHKITLNGENWCLFTGLGINGNVHDIKINASNISEVNGGIPFALNDSYTFGVVYNYGTIKNLSIDNAANMTVNYNMNYAYLSPSVVEKDTESETLKKGIYANSEITFGMITAYNYGVIDNCGVENNLALTTQFCVDYQDGRILKEDGTEIDINSDSYKINLIKYEYKDLTRNLSIDTNIGVVAGVNSGLIKNVTMNAKQVTINSQISETMPKQENETTIDINTSITELHNLGLISGSNEFDEDYSILTYNGDNCGVNSTKILNTQLILGSNIQSGVKALSETTETSATKTNSTDKNNNRICDYASVMVGLISGYSQLGFNGCVILGSSIDNSENTTKGTLAGSILPTVYSVTKYTEYKNINKSVEIYTAFIPQVTNCFATSLDFFGSVGTITIGTKTEDYNAKSDNKNGYVSTTASEITTNFGENSTITGYCEFFCYNPGEISISYDETETELRAKPNSINNGTETLTIKLADNVSNETTLQGYVEDEIQDGDGNPITGQGLVTFDKKLQVKLKLDLKDGAGNVINDEYNQPIYYCYMANGEKVYMSGDKTLNNFVKLSLVKVDGSDIIVNSDLTKTDNKEIVINGQNFIATVTYDTNITSIDNGFKLVVKYTNLRTKIAMITDQTLSEIMLPSGMSFSKVNETDISDDLLKENFSKDKTYYVNYTFTKDGETYTIKNITVIPTDNSGKEYENNTETSSGS